ncbi:hypothetical protein PybrP1_011208 [[Pythium] brassicae (nom. inval.)]|nr:hypothetical protein PybrP1_011208 [[Pythium] brassicae (nom. inval.)]
MQRQQYARLLALVVQARDLARSSSAVAAVLQHTPQPLDLVQLRADAADDVADVAAAAHYLQSLFATADFYPAITRSPLLVLNAPLDAVAQLRDPLVASGGFAGWHVKEHELLRTSEELHRLLATRAPREVVGCSVHSVAAAELAAQLELDYVQVGTMFETASHPEKRADALEGPALLRTIAARRPRGPHGERLAMPPLVAVGGIGSALHVREVLRAGASGVAVIRGILAADDPEAAAAALRAALDAPSERE